MRRRRLSKAEIIEQLQAELERERKERATILFRAAEIAMAYQLSLIHLERAEAKIRKRRMRRNG